MEQGNRILDDILLLLLHELNLREDILSEELDEVLDIVFRGLIEVENLGSFNFSPPSLQSNTYLS